jgi:hypothetical protein
MLIYRGAKAVKSFAALIELADMLIPRVTIIRPIAPKAAAARPPWEPDFIHKLMISMGFQRTSPYAAWEAAAVKMPRRPTMAGETN